MVSKYFFLSLNLSFLTLFDGTVGSPDHVMFDLVVDPLRTNVFLFANTTAFLLACVVLLIYYKQSSKEPKEPKDPNDPQEREKARARTKVEQDRRMVAEMQRAIEANRQRLEKLKKRRGNG